MSSTAYPKITLPLRSHLGCDPFCKECQQWQKELAAILKPTVREAQEAFVSVLVKRFPEIVDVSPHGGGEFNDACEEFALDAAESSLRDIAESPKRAKRGKVLQFGGAA